MLMKRFRDMGKGGLVIIVFEKTGKVPEIAYPEKDGGGLSDPKRMEESRSVHSVADHDPNGMAEPLEWSLKGLQEANLELTAAHKKCLSVNEELQSVNEELKALNANYQLRLQELSELKNDMDHLLSSTKIGMIFLDHRLRVKRFTPVVTKEINLMPIDVDRPLEHITHNFAAYSIVKDAEEAIRTFKPMEKEIQSTNGSWYSLSIQPYRTMEKETKGVILTLVDISEIKSAGTELQKLSYAIEQSPSIMVIAKLNGSIDYVNQKFTEQTGYLPQDVIGRSLWDIHTPAYTQPMQQQVLDLLASGNKWTGEVESEKKNKETFWEGVSILPIKNPEGKIVHILKVSQDITERKNTEELLRKSEMLSAVGQLAAGIAHEIRNPLTALKGFTKLLDAGTNNKTYTQIMTAELDRIETIISELLVLAKPQIWNFYKKDVIFVLQDVLILLETQAIMNNVEIITDFEPGIPPITCVENQLKQVFINLLKNGIEAMPEGGILHVGVSRHDHQYVQITFSDQGCGIAEDKIPKLGEPFYSTKDKGTGLGLMVSFKIIQNHDGKIAIKSEVNRGTSVEILLPIEGYAG